MYGVGQQIQARAGEKAKLFVHWPCKKGLPLNAAIVFVAATLILLFPIRGVPPKQLEIGSLSVAAVCFRRSFCPLPCI